MSRLLSILTTLLLPATVLQAQGPGMSPTSKFETKDLAAAQEDRIGATVDTNLAFVDERDYPFTLGQLFPGETPVVLMLGYYSCPAMCGQVLSAAFDALSQVELQPGEHYQILSVSIDPKETPQIAATRKQNFLKDLRKTRGDEAWHLLVGDEANTKALAASVGFNYYWSEATQQFSHPPSLIFLTPAGKVSRIISNTYFEPSDVRLAIVEASNGQLGDFWDQVRLNCLTFDPRTNQYELTAMTVMRIGGVLTVLVLGGMIWVMLRRERRARAIATANEPSTSRQPVPDGAGRTV